MIKKILSAGCSFTYGHELSDCDSELVPPSKKSWAAGLTNLVNADYKCIAVGGSGNAGIARRIIHYINNWTVDFVLVMWSFPSRYDWAMPRHKNLENTRWATITPWDTNDSQKNVMQKLSSNQAQQEIWKKRRKKIQNTGVVEFADSLYRYAANEYHEIYQSWKSIIWLQNILEKKRIPYLFTLADNSLFYKEVTPHAEQDSLMRALYSEIDFTNWYFFGERMMGFDQWALLNDYPRGTTHPLDSAHQDAVQLMKDKFLQIYNQKETQ
jgi:hypothetical protein